MLQNLLSVCLIMLLQVLLLSGCANMATSGAQAIYNHRSIQKNINDQMTTFHVYQALNSAAEEFDDTHIEVITFNNEVLLVGQVHHEWQKTKLEHIVSSLTDDVEHIYNLVAVANLSSSLTRVSDIWITAKVKAKLIASADVDATQIKVITENGTVYLMGVLQPEEASAAVELASTTHGVQYVVKAFSYIHITRA